MKSFNLALVMTIVTLIPDASGGVAFTVVPVYGDIVTLYVSSMKGVPGPRGLTASTRFYMVCFIIGIFFGNTHSHFFTNTTTDLLGSEERFIAVEHSIKFCFPSWCRQVRSVLTPPTNSSVMTYVLFIW